MGSRLRSSPAAFAVALVVTLAAREVGAQGRSHGNGHARGVPPAHAKRVVTTDRAVVVTRDVLVSHGYDLVRVERVGGSRVIYYRRGNMGRGRGRGPLQRMIVRPVEDRVVFEQAPRPLLADIKVRLGL
jgi:hypothetical protein